MHTENAAPAFMRAEDQALSERFLADGYVIVPASDREALDRIQGFVARTAAEHLGVPLPSGHTAFLDGIGAHVRPENLNALRLAVIGAVMAEPWFRPAYYACGRDVLDRLIGNELAMQRGIGLAVQLPDDAESVLPLHSDAWSEDSPFELVLWIPLVDCMRTKSMFLLGPQRDVVWRERMHEFAPGGVEALFRAVEPEVQWLDIPYGHVLVFAHTLMHGNRTNREKTARWSMNVRFKGLFTPYSDKKLGDFFEPITVRAATRVGMAYRLPGGFNE